MSPVIKPKGETPSLPPKFWVFVISGLCLALMILTFHSDFSSVFFRGVLGAVLTPFEKGVARAGSLMTERSKELASIRDLLEENRRLKEELDALTIENTALQQEKYELAALRSLYALDEEYDEFEKVGARIISKDSGNWYHSFLIDKGKQDGIEVNMNVMAGSGLVGRVDARVLSIISDNSNVSCMVLSAQSNLIVSGSLEDYAQGVIDFAQLFDPDAKVVPGDKIVTSQISEKYLPGILVGYVAAVADDANNLTRSGTLTPAVDFAHLDEVLVLLRTKELPEDPFGEER